MKTCEIRQRAGGYGLHLLLQLVHIVGRDPRLGSGRGARAAVRRRGQVPAAPLLHRVLQGVGLVAGAGDGALVQGRVRVGAAPGGVRGRRQVGPHRGHGRAVGGRVDALPVHGPGPHGAHPRAAPAAPGGAHGGPPARPGRRLVRWAQGGAQRPRGRRGAGRGAGAGLAGDLGRLVDVAHDLLELRRALRLLLVVKGDLLGELPRRRHVARSLRFPGCIAVSVALKVTTALGLSSNDNTNSTGTDTHFAHRHTHTHT